MNISGGWHVGLEFIAAVLITAFISIVVGKTWKSRWTVIASALIGVMAGAAFGVEALRATGYVAPYSFAAAWALSLIFTIAALPLLPFPPLRRGGLIALLTGLSMLAAFYLVVMTARLFGLTAWQT